MKSKEQMLNEDLFQIVGAINRNKNKGSNTFKLKCLINKEKAEERIEKLKQACGVDIQSEEIKQYQHELEGLQREYSEKDEDGNIILYDAQTDKVIDPRQTEGKKVITKVVKERQKDYISSLKALNKKYEKSIEEDNKKQEEFKKALKDNVDPQIDWEIFQWEELPEIDFADDLKALLPLINR